MMRSAIKVNRNKFVLLGFVICISFAVPFLLPDSFSKHTFFMILLWAINGVAWNMLAGNAGQTSLGHGMFFGIGAYVSTMLLVRLHISPWIGMLVSVLVVVFIAMVLGKALFRLSGFYFSIATIALSEVLLVLFTSWSFVGDARGLFIPIVPGGNSLWMIQFRSKEPYCILALVLLIICVIASHRLSISKAGYYFRAIRDESEGAESLGVNITKYKTIAYVFSAIFCALAGVLYSTYTLYIDPDSVMNLKISTQIALVAILGGIGTLWGPIVGSVVLNTISESARLFLGGAGMAVDLLLYSLFIVFFAVFQPNGIAGLIFSIRSKLSKNNKVSVIETDN